MNEDKNFVCYELLMKVFRDNAYASIELNSVLPKCKDSDKAYITKLFYGVLERNVYYDYVLSQFAAQKPKKPIAVLIKMGYYLLENMNLPPYAAVDNIVKLCKKAGKGGSAGFINSALRNFKPAIVPEEKTSRYISLKHSYPLWLCELLIKDYGFEFTDNLLSYEPEKRVHIRVNTGNISYNEFENKYRDNLAANDKSAEATPFGYYVPHKILSGFDKKDYVVQSLSSVYAVKAYINNIGAVKNVLDLCAAPGGKAVLTASETGAAVTACDIYPHRVNMIRNYAARCKVKINAELNDATVLRGDWKEKFDLVICDVPCSGIGVASAKPDILYNRTEEDVESLTVIQAKILQTATNYVAAGGRLCYSTCTVLKEENSEIVKDFLSKNQNFAKQEITSPVDKIATAEISLFPHINHCDGFYVAVMQKIS